MRNVVENPRLTIDAGTSDTFSGNMPYQIILPSNINIFKETARQVQSIKNHEVQRNTQKILKSLYRALVTISNAGMLSNYLSRLHVTEQSDETALIEWNFEHFRIGFNIEHSWDDVTYYFVAEDKRTGSFISQTSKIGDNYDQLVFDVVNYAIQNT